MEAVILLLLSLFSLNQLPKNLRVLRVLGVKTLCAFPSFASKKKPAVKRFTPFLPAQPDALPPQP
jgi:hypothetical protein